MHLVSTSQIIELVTGSALSTDYTVHYADHTSSGVLSGNNVGNVATATTTTIVSAPASSTTRQIFLITVKNKHASSTQTVRLQLDNGGTDYYVSPTVSLLPGETLHYTRGRCFVAGTRGEKKATILGKVMANFLATYAWVASTSGSHSHTSGTTYAQYIGKAYKSGSSSVQVRYNVATALNGSVTWGEIAIAKGPPLWMKFPTLRVIGYADVTAIANSTGRKTTQINLSSGETISEGDDLWFLGGSQASTPMVIRSCANTATDGVDQGWHVSQSVRPSTIDKIPFAFQTVVNGSGAHSVVVTID